ncbi:MAG: amidohydrolase [Deltaproteobacteria bacterium]|nr:amidohydrolase [Deltaproteobacteria bacterium]
MTIDMHCHLFVEEFHNDNYVYAFWNPGQQKSLGLEEAIAISKERNALRPSPWDPDGTINIKRMDEAGIEKAVILHLDYGIIFGEAALTIEQQNKYVSEIVKRFPDRLLWFCGIDPRRPEAAGLFEKCVTQWGARGIKLYPTTGFLAADREAYPLYERASAWGIPVYFHMGPENPPYRNEGNAHPSTLLRVLVDFPDLKVIVAHLGFDFWRDLLALGKVCENVMCDFCAWQRVAKRNYEQFSRILRRFIDEFGRERIFFGTDAPFVEDFVSSKEWVELVRDLPNQAPSPNRFTPEEISALMEGNAKRLLATAPKI